MTRRRKSQPPLLGVKRNGCRCRSILLMFCPFRRNPVVEGGEVEVVEKEVGAALAKAAIDLRRLSMLAKIPPKIVAVNTRIRVAVSKARSGLRVVGQTSSVGSPGLR